MQRRGTYGFAAGGLIGSLGGLIGLVGAEFRLPVLVGLFRLPTLEAVIFNKAMSLAVVAAALLCRLPEVPVDAMLTEAAIGLHDGSAHLIANPVARWVAGLVAGFGIGMVAALLGVAGGELLIPTIVLLYGMDIRVAGSLSLAVSLPTMLVGFTRYRRSDAFSVLTRERRLFGFMLAGSVLGAAVGALLLGLVSPRALMALLGIVLLISAIKVFQHAIKDSTHVAH
jgi:uncharacterized membrane protein YfcA